MRRFLWYAAKTLQGGGLLVILVGVLLSIDLGLEEEGLKSMAIEFRGLMLGGALFLAGWLLERVVGGRG